jgi:putative addiction module component (TIGR02574 family)
VKPPKVDLRNLTPSQRLDLLGEIWDSLTANPDQLVLTDSQRAELDRRLDELDQDSVRGIPWDEVLEKIRKRAG